MDSKNDSNTFLYKYSYLLQVRSGTQRTVPNGNEYVTDAFYFNAQTGRRTSQVPYPTATNTTDAFYVHTQT
jgi:hypothetical protein